MTKPLYAVLSLCLFVVLCASSKAATINWEGGAQDITGDGDVIDSGSVVYAFNLGATGVASTTVNDVAFQALAFPDLYEKTVTSGNVTFSENIGYLDGGNQAGYSTGSFSDLPTAYQGLLGSYGFSFPGMTLTLTMSGLSQGQQYEFEWWSSISYGYTYSSDTTEASAGNSVSLQYDTTSAPGGVGQYAVGLFTADGPTQSISFNSVGGYDPFINGFVLEDAPEPSIYRLLLVSVAFLGCWCAFRFRVVAV